MNPEIISPENGDEEIETMQLFGIECVIERVGSQNIKVSCRSRENAYNVVTSFWEKRSPEDLMPMFKSGRLKPDTEITDGARTSIVERKNQKGGFNFIVLINENGNPFREETLSVLRDAGMTI